MTEELEIAQPSVFEWEPLFVLVLSKLAPNEKPSYVCQWCRGFKTTRPHGEQSPFPGLHTRYCGAAEGVAKGDVAYVNGRWLYRVKK